MKKLSELTLIVNGLKMKVQQGYYISLADEFGNYQSCAVEQILVDDSKESQPGNMDIVKQYIDDLRHISGIKRENQ